MSWGTSPVLHSWEHGPWAGRRREENFVVQQQCRWRLVRAQSSHVLALYDGANAFGSTPKGVVFANATARLKRADVVHYKVFHSMKVVSADVDGTLRSYRMMNDDAMCFSTSPRKLMKCYRPRL